METYSTYVATYKKHYLIQIGNYTTLLADHMMQTDINCIIYVVTVMH